MLDSKVNLFEPFIYHRQYENDLCNKDVNEEGLFNQALRVTQVALPFLSLYKPISQPLTIVLSAARTVSCVSQLIEAIKEGERTDIAFALLQTALTVASLACTIFAHPLGMLISTGHDLMLNVVQLIEAIQKEDYKKAIENGVQILNNCLYLALFFTSAPELLIVSTAVQILSGLYQSHEDFNKGNYLEGFAHLLMAGIRSHQLHSQVATVKMKWDVDAALKKYEGSREISDAILKEEYITSCLNPSSDDVAALIIKYSGTDGLPALFHAAENNDMDAVKSLLMFGGDSRYALYGSIRGRHMPLLQWLVEEYKVPFINSDWVTYWNSTCWWEGFDYLIKKGGNIPALDYYLPCSYSIHVLRGLVERGAKFSSVFDIGLMYQMIFAKDFNPTLRTLIFESLNKNCGLPVDASFKYFGVNPLQPSTYTPLTFAVEHNDFATAKALLNLGADPNLQGWGFPPLKWAVINQNTQMIAMLISYGAKAIV